MQIDGKRYFVPYEGFVPDGETATRIAEAVWKPIYGERLEQEKPFQAYLQNGIWYVKGSMPGGEHREGVAYAEIRKADGEILRVSREK